MKERKLPILLLLATLFAACSQSPASVLLDAATDRQIVAQQSGTPHVVTYLASAASAGAVNVSIMDNSGKEDTFQQVASPWSYSGTFHSGQYASIFASAGGRTSDSVSVSISVDGTSFRSAQATSPASAVAGGFVP